MTTWKFIMTTHKWIKIGRYTDCQAISNAIIEGNQENKFFIAFGLGHFTSTDI